MRIQSPMILSKLLVSNTHIHVPRHEETILDKFDNAYIARLAMKLFSSVQSWQVSVCSGKTKRSISSISTLKLRHWQLKRQNTYNSRYSLVVTHPTTNLTIYSLYMGERTGSLVFCSLWSYVQALIEFYYYIGIPQTSTSQGDGLKSTDLCP